MHQSSDIYYKYRKVDIRAFEILLNRELWFAAPDTMNDPLDCQMMVGESLQAVIDSTKDDEKRKTLVALRDWDVRNKFTNARVPLHLAASNLVRTAGVLSLSKCATEALMWSHYGGGHKGICIGFDASFFTGLLKDHPKYELVGAQEVEYPPISPFQEFFEGNSQRLRELLLQGNPDEFAEFRSEYQYELIVACLLTKSARWEYEGEYRIVKSKSGSLQFPPLAVKEIIFGVKATDSDIQTVRNILFSNDWRHVQFKRAKFVVGSFEMAVDTI